MNSEIISLPTKPTNIIFTGVAGTGKTHRLLSIQQLYDELIDTSWGEWCLQQMHGYSWCEVVCAVLLLEDRLMSVPEIMRHPLIKDKATVNERNDNINQTIWVQLNTHAHPDSTTVNYKQRSANYYFDKTEASHWYVLEEVKPILREGLADLLSLYHASKSNQSVNSHTIRRSTLVSFHQSYGYDEFVEGIRPHVNPTTGQMQYDIQSGAFLSLCAKAAKDPEHRYAMLIDEINRANTAQVFGELMSVIEPSKRSGAVTPMSVRLAYSGREFSVPSNVDIYATMNTQDHSLAALDTAFRRRFDFVTCYPDATIVNTITDGAGEQVDLAKMMQAINQRLYHLFGAQTQLGHAYFMQISDIGQLSKRLYRQIIPQLIEYINLNAVPAQVFDLLTHILYGYSESKQLSQISHPLLQRYPISDVSVSSASDVKQPLNTSSYAMGMLFVPEFVTVASQQVATPQSKSISKQDDTSVNKKSADNVQPYLTAIPYQQLYTAYSSLTAS